MGLQEGPDFTERFFEEILKAYHTPIARQTKEGTLMILALFCTFWKFQQLFGTL